MNESKVDRIIVSGHIVIDRKPADVFAYISNLENDSEWRKEINSTRYTGGNIALEDSRLSKRVPSNVLRLERVAYSEGEKVVYRTQKTERFFLLSAREVSEDTGGRTKFTYSIEFDRAIVKHGIGFGLPAFIVRAVTRSSMKSYLKKLKDILEKNS